MINHPSSPLQYYDVENIANKISLGELLQDNWHIDELTPTEERPILKEQRLEMSLKAFESVVLATQRIRSISINLIIELQWKGSVQNDLEVLRRFDLLSERMASVRYWTPPEIDIRHEANLLLSVSGAAARIQPVPAPSGHPAFETLGKCQFAYVRKRAPDRRRLLWILKGSELANEVGGHLSR
jgi:hypothetical protein